MSVGSIKIYNTGCEHIFQLIASELNGAKSDGFDWHKRLLERMGIKQIGRPAVFSAQSVNNLREYLGFRRVVRNLYGFELDPARIDKLVENYPAIWLQVSKELSRFVDWLLELANQLDRIG